MVSPRAIGASLALVALSATTETQAEPYRLRADVFAETADPAAFAIVQVETQSRGLLLVDAEAMVWGGVGVDAESSPEAMGEAVLASVRLRDPIHGLGVRLGRQLYYGGAIRPLHFDGATITARAPSASQVELFGGIPVVPRWQGRSFDWLVGGRITQAMDDLAQVGASYWQARDDGALTHSQIGAEGAVNPLKVLTVSSTAAFDTSRSALVDARISAVLHDEVNRAELFALRRSPSLLLPATSLFAALGSFDVDQLGLTGSYRVAPRLDLSATATVDRAANSPGATQILRAELRLDDDGRGAVGVEGHRVSMPSASWTGARAWLRLPLIEELSASTEVEVAVPDEPADRGIAWPWLLVGLRYQPLTFLEAAAAFETSSTPQYDVSVGGVLRLSGRWGTR